MTDKSFDAIQKSEIKTLAQGIDVNKDAVIQKKEVIESADKIKSLADKLDVHLDDIKKIPGLESALS